MSNALVAKEIQVIKLPSRQQRSDNSARESMKTLLTDIVIRMLGSAGDVSVSYAVGEKTTIFKVDCPKEVLGRLIGCKGKNISSLRNIVSAMMWQEGIRAIIEIPYYKAEDK